MKKIVRVMQVKNLLRSFLTLVFFMACLIVFGQDSTTSATQDSTNDWADWVSRILAAIGILLPGWDAYKAGARSRAAKAQELFTHFVNMVDNNDFSSTSLRDLANKGRDVIKKEDKNV